MSDFDKFKGLIVPNAQAVHVAENLSAMQRDLDETMRGMASRAAAKEVAILRTAEESVIQTELLNNQLQEVKTQNELLRENYRTLKELYDKVKTEAEDSKQAAEKSRKREKIAIWVAVLSPIVSITASILIAVFS